MYSIVFVFCIYNLYFNSCLLVFCDTFRILLYLYFELIVCSYVLYCPFECVFCICKFDLHFVFQIVILYLYVVYVLCIFILYLLVYIVFVLWMWFYLVFIFSVHLYCVFAVYLCHVLFSICILYLYLNL